MAEEQSHQRCWVWYGGRLSVDFVNTRKERFGPGRELLNTPEDLAAWLLAAELSGPVTPTQRQLIDARELREAIDAGIYATVMHAPIPAAAIQTLNSWLARAGDFPPRLHLHQDTLVLHTTSRPSDTIGALYRIAHDAAAQLGSDDRARLRICQGDHCSARFADNSAGQRRRWCRMAVCGNRAKAAAHRHATTHRH